MVREWDVLGKRGTNKDCWKRMVELWEKKTKGLETHLPPPPPFSRPRNEVTTLKQRREEGRGSESMRERERAKD